MEYKFKDLALNIIILLKRRNKKTYIRLRSPNIVEISTPLKLSYKDLDEMLLRNYSFIKKGLEKISTQALIKDEAIANRSLHLLGEEYTLVVKESDTDGVIISGSEFIVYSKRSDEGYIRYLVYQKYYEELKRVVNQNIYEIRDKFKLKFPITIGYKDVKSYFGKCYFNEHKVIFSLYLAKYKEEHIISVIYHELAHFYYHDHQAGFYSLLDSLYPGFKTLQHEMKMIKYRDIY